MNRRELLVAAIVVATGIYTSIPCKTKYNTPVGDEPIEVYINNEWVEYPFDSLSKGQIMRKISNKTVTYKIREVLSNGVRVDTIYG